MDISLNINSIFQRRIVFFVFLCCFLIKSFIFGMFSCWLFFQISTGYNENIATLPDFYTGNVRQTTLQWFNYLSLIFGILFFIITIKSFHYLGRYNKNKVFLY